MQHLNLVRLAIIGMHSFNLSKYNIKVKPVLEERGCVRAQQPDLRHEEKLQSPWSSLVTLRHDTQSLTSDVCLDFLISRIITSTCTMATPNSI